MSAAELKRMDLNREAVLLIMETGFSLGCVVSIVLHLLLPYEGVPGHDDEEMPDVEKPSGFYEEAESTHPAARPSLVDYNKPIFPINHPSQQLKQQNSTHASDVAAPGNYKVEMAQMKRENV